MGGVKNILFQMQKNEMKLKSAYDQEVTEEAASTLKEYIQYLKNKTEQCKALFSKLIESPLTPVEIKVDINELLKTLT